MSKFLYHGTFFDGETESRDVYKIMLLRAGIKPLIFNFGQSLANSSDGSRKRINPTAYDVLSCLTKYDPGTFEMFCGELGYDTDSRRAERVYYNVKLEFFNVRGFWNPEELRKLREID